MQKILDIKNLSNSFLFNNLSLTVYHGDFISISGSSSCGKTTLLRTIMQYIPYKGIINKDENLTISYIDESIIMKTPYKNMMEAFLSCTTKIGMIKNVAKEYHIDEIINKDFTLLTNQELIKYQLALSELKEIKLLLLDDIFLTFSEEEKLYFLRLFEEKCHTGSLTVILATTSLFETLYSNYLYIMQEGKFILEGIPNLVYAEDHTLVKLGINNSFYVDLSLKLKFYEVINEIYNDEEQLMEALWK
ncbi:MAG: ATP-binding cassette domain-containing protein [Bacilli bacterium]